MYVLLRDDRVLRTFLTEIECLIYLQQIQSQSMNWACKHEGYKILNHYGNDINDPTIVELNKLFNILKTED